MRDCTDLISKYSTKYDWRLRKITEPLLKLGIDSFWSFSINNEGYFTYLGNQGEMAEYFSDQKLYKGHFFYRHPKLFRSGFYLESSILLEEDRYQATQGIISKKFSMDQLLVHVETDGVILEAYAFATQNSSIDMKATYLSNIDLLRKFIFFFNREANDLVLKVNENKVLIGPECGDDFYRKSIADYELKRKDQFLDLIREERSQFELTKKEKETACWVLRGRSASQIAIEMGGLSPRTIEHYVENLKNKLGCLNKAELFDQLLNLKERGFLS